MIELVVGIMVNGLELFLIERWLKTRRTTVTCRPRVTWSGDHRMSEIHLAQGR